MKVSEFIELLKRANQDAEVFVDGYEGGLVPLDSEFQVYETDIVKDYHTTCDYYGSAEKKSEVSSFKSDDVQYILGVIVSRNEQ